MRMLIVGCGYLGRRVAEAWLASGHSVHALTRSIARGEEFRSIGIEPIVGDVTDAVSLQGLPDVDVVLHAVGLDRSSGRTQREVYVDGLRNVLRAMVGRTQHFVQISSTSVYSQNDGEWIDEASECRPIRENGIVCLEAERLLAEECGRGSECRWQVLRLSGIYGPGRLLQRVEALRRGEPISGNADAWLNLIHVDDACRMVQAAIHAPQNGRTLLVSDDRPILRREYYELLAGLVSAPTPQFPRLEEHKPERREINKRCRNHRLHADLDAIAAGLNHLAGFSASQGRLLMFPTIAEGLPHAVAALK